MKAFAVLLMLAGAPLSVAPASAAASAPTNDTQASAASSALIVATEFSARKKHRGHRHAHRVYRQSYGYDRPYNQGYYRGVQPGWGYGPDPGDRAWPPFHFKPYW
jgi:hypothetical protein